MKRIIIRAETQDDYEKSVQSYLDNGYVLDQSIASHPMVLENHTVWPLILYEKEEEKPKEEKKVGEFDDILDVATIDNEGQSQTHETILSQRIKEGWTVYAIYQKNVIVVKRRKEETKQ